jgi:hypothetical protein
VGLFDDVRCEYPLPDPAHQGLSFQTKDLECLLDEYVITRRGRLVRTRSGFLEPRGRRVACPIHQDLRIHASVEVGPEEREWVEYVFRFTAGRVTRVRRSRDRHRYTVKTLNPEGWRKPPDPPTASIEAQAVARLEPALYPRRPTPEEFSSHTPEKIELFDGHIPGEEKLLLLLLTTVGLRRAVQLVGPELWRRAAAPIRWPSARASLRGSRKPRR